MSTLRLRSLLSLGLLATALSPLGFAQTATPPPPAGGAPAPETTRRATTATATSAQASAETMIGPIKFGDITIDAALDMLERWSGRAILRPAGLPATSISFSLNQKVTKAEAQQALETLLTMNGIAVIPLGDKLLKVTPLNTARTEAPDFIEGSTLGLAPSGHIAAKLFQLQFLRVAEFAPQIASLLNVGAASPPVLFEKSNSALVTDTISNLQRIEMLIAQLDQPALNGLTPKFYKVQNTTASELVTKIQGILSGPAAIQLGTTTTYQADDRTNQIILISDERQHAFFDDLVAKLDTAGESSTRQEVILLKHANATEMGTLLTSLITGQTSTARTTQTQNNAVRGAMNSLAAQRAAAQQNNAANGNPAGNNNAQGANGNAAARQAARQAAGLNVTTGLNGNLIINAGASAPQQFSEILTVVPDERSNALVVSGTVDDMRLIKDLISQLDVLLAQVRIEVIIAEVTLSDQSSTGIDALGLVIQADKVVGFSGSGPGFTAGSATSPFTLVDATTGAKDLSGTLGLSTTPRKSNINILSAPNIVTSHNKEASLFVGEKRPVISSYINNGNNGTTNNFGSSSVTQTEIGITLTVTPLIGHDGSVQLEIEQKVDDVLDTVLLDGNAQPVIGSRTANSFVSARSGEIVVLGGLQRKTLSKSTSRLGGIPLIGDLLGSRSRNNTRTDLVFFLRPYILTNTPADNVEAMQRLETSPQKKDLEATLKGQLPVKS